MGKLSQGSSRQQRKGMGRVHVRTGSVDTTKTAEQDNRVDQREPCGIEAAENITAPLLAPNVFPPLTLDWAGRRSRGDWSDMNWRREGPCRGSPELALLEGWGQLIGPGPGARLPLAFCQIGDQMYRSSGRGHLVGWWAGWEAPGQKMQALGWRRGRLPDRDKTPPMGTDTQTPTDTPVEPAHHTSTPSSSRAVQG